MGQNITDLTQIRRFPDYRPVAAFKSLRFALLFTDGYEMMHKAWSSIEDVPYCFSTSSIKFQGHKSGKYCWFWTRLRISGLKHKCEFTDGFEMMHEV